MTDQPLSLDEIIQKHRFDVVQLPPAEAFANCKAALERLLLQERIGEQEGIKQVLEMARAVHGPLAKVNLDGLIEATNNRIAELAALTKEQQ